MKLLIKDNKIKIRKAVIDLTELNSNRLCLSSYTSLGKSRLVDIMIAQNYTNVKILRDLVLEDTDFLKLSKSIDIVVLDDCSFNKQHETFLKRFIIEDTRLYIIIGRRIFIPGMECLDFLNYNDKVIVQQSKVSRHNKSF